MTHKIHQGEKMLEFLSDNFSQCVWLAVLIVSIIPTIESKVAIPFGMASHIWGDNALSPLVSFCVACLGSMLPAILVIIFARFVRNRASGFVYDKFVTKVERKFQRNFDKLSAGTNDLKKCMLLCLFVAVPLPFTGVYSGSLIAGFTNIPIVKSFLAIFVGEIISCSVVSLLCLVFENSTFYVLVVSLVLIGVYLLVNTSLSIVKRLIKKEKR